jgi:Tol biopolymer transport system component
MRNDDYMADLPEALPADGVSPAWKIVAIVEMVGLAILLLTSFLLGIALLVQTGRRAATTAAAQQQAAAAARQQAAARNPPRQAPAQNGADEGPQGGLADQGNLPYPVKEDVPRIVQHELPARKRFLELAREIWKSPPGQYPTAVAVSGDGQNIAYIANQELLVGPFEAPLKVGPGMPAFMAGPAMPDTKFKPAGTPIWSHVGGLLYVADADGHVRGFIGAPAWVTSFTCKGSAAAPLPGVPRNELVVVRSQSRPKADVPGSPAAPDQTEVVRRDWTNQVVQTVVPPGDFSWSYLDVSPDGKQLVLVSEHRQAAEPIKGRVYVAPMDGGKMRLQKIPGSVSAPVCWTPDSKSLVYTRGQYEPGVWPLGADLFEWDLAAGRETRLSRGGGFSSPSVSANGDVFFMLWKQDDQRAAMHLYRASLAELRRFASTEPPVAAHDVGAWQRLVDQVCKDCDVQAIVDGQDLTPALLARLAESFTRRYQQQFADQSPADPQAFDRQRTELSGLRFSGSVRPRIRLVAGAAEGEFLRRQHGAEWHLTQGPLARAVPAGNKPEPESPFGLVLNPFLGAVGQGPGVVDPDDDEEAFAPNLAWQLKQAAGRSLVLANDPKAGREAVAALDDRDLVQAGNLLEHDQGARAELLLLEMTKKQRHTRNDYLALHVGKLLYEHGRVSAARQLMERQCQRGPRDARKFNLLGLALLKEAEQAGPPGARSERAIAAFKDAVRCDLRFESGYLNLAEAYRQAGDWQSARMCLQRDLQVLPYGAFVRDARQRLAALEGESPR